jgi:molecular chaperone GrpE (heat shock protein)
MIYPEIDDHDVQEGFIISEIKAGYLYGDKVIHPSDVIVSSGNE